MLSFQTFITGLIAATFIGYFVGYLPIKSFLQSRGKDKEWKECGYCAQQSEKAKRCAGCKSIFYCSVKCQAEHWKFGHKKVCKSKSSTKVVKAKKKKKKKKVSEKKRQFMNMLESFSSLAANDENESGDDHSNNHLDVEALREEYKNLIDKSKLTKEWITFYSFKVLGYGDEDIPPYEGNESFGQQQISLNEMIESMIMTKRMIIRDPELKREMDKKILAYKQQVRIAKQFCT